MSDDYYYDKPSGPPDDYPGPDRDDEDSLYADRILGAAVEDEAIEVLDTAFTRLVPVTVEELQAALELYGDPMSYRHALRLLDQFEMFHKEP